jgi:hypothetical protein
MQVKPVWIDVKKNKLIIACARAYSLLDLYEVVRQVRINHMTVWWISRLTSLQNLSHSNTLTKWLCYSANFFLFDTTYVARHIFATQLQFHTFLEHVSFTDGSSFDRQNTRIWAYKNPHAMAEKYDQEP